MASNTRNVKLGVCTVTFKGTDLGYTSGGVEVTVKTDTHKTSVDQFGKTSINETITGREVMAKTPLAETTIANLVAIMPGAVMTATGGAVATGTITVTTNPAAADTILINGVTFTFKTVLTGAANEVLIAASAALTAANLHAALTASLSGAVESASYSVASAIVTVTFGSVDTYGSTGYKSAAGNAFTLGVGTAGVKVTLSGTTLSGGVDSTGQSVVVATGIGTSLLDIAGELRLHPIAKAANDLSEDFVILLAATAGALKFAYKLDSERIYDVDFSGFPNASGKLFSIGE
ncbi:hypothetical protein LP414_27815 [Polaromonas sp. P1(28)-13]|nr:hypothetical protein LP414_27815 [Polaromonas sp. P1(28)-13]